MEDIDEIIPDFESSFELLSHAKKPNGTRNTHRHFIRKSEIANLEECANALMRCGKTLLDFSQGFAQDALMRSNTVPLLKKKFNLESVLVNVIDINRAAAKEKKLDLRLQYDAALPKWVIGDSKRMYRIILELLSNALNNTNRGHILLSAKLAQKIGNRLIVKIAIKDTGIGITQDKQQEVFVRFKKSPFTQNAGERGLSIVKQYLDDLEGEIYVKSDPYEGTAFTCVVAFQEPLLLEDEAFELDSESEVDPIKKGVMASVHSKMPARNDQGLGKPIRVLVVEDYPITAKITQTLMAGLNCYVDIASTGELALKKSKQSEYDLIFMDIGLPDMGGAEVTKLIRFDELLKDRSPVPIIGLTANADFSDRQQCIESGMNVVFIKPLVKEKLQEILNSLINSIPGNDALIGQGRNGQTSTSKVVDKVIDLELGAKLMDGNKTLAQEMITLLAKNLIGDLMELKEAYQKLDWETIQNIAHRLRGGTSYCGTPRLKVACAQLEDHLLSVANPTEYTDILYLQLVREIDEVQKHVSKSGNGSVGST